MEERTPHVDQEVLFGDDYEYFDFPELTPERTETEVSSMIELADIDRGLHGPHDHVPADAVLHRDRGHVVAVLTDPPTRFDAGPLGQRRPRLNVSPPTVRPASSRSAAVRTAAEPEPG